MRLPDVRPRAERSIIRFALYSGFGLVLLLWAGSSYDFSRYLQSARGETAKVHEWFLSTELLLDDVRAGVLQASVDLGDALLDSSASNDQYRRELREQQANVEKALDGYMPHAHSDAERADLAALRQAVAGFWEAAEPVLRLDESGRVDEAFELMSQQIGPRRESIRQVSDRIKRLNDSAASDLRAATDAANASMQRRIWTVANLSLLFGLAIAIAVTEYADRLEHQIRRETAKNAEGLHALRRLSEQLVVAQETERRRIARELHDEIGQALTALKIELAGPPESGNQCERLAAAREIADQTLKSVRALSRGLHPMVLETLGLLPALEWYLGQFSARTGIPTDLAHTGFAERLAPRLESCLYRIVQEAATNVARHAQATRCRVTLQASAGRILLIVEDDGRGFDPGAVQDDTVPRGLGLVGMRERVAALGGEMALDTRAGRGTRIAVDLPAEAAEGGEAEAASVGRRPQAAWPAGLAPM